MNEDELRAMRERESRRRQSSLSHGAGEAAGEGRSNSVPHTPECSNTQSASESFVPEQFQCFMKMFSTFMQGGHKDGGPSTESASRRNPRDLPTNSLQKDLLPTENSHQKGWSSSVHNNTRERSPDDRRTLPPLTRAAQGFSAQPSTERAPQRHSPHLRDMQNTSLRMDLLPRDNSHQRRWSSSVQHGQRKRSPDDRRNSLPLTRDARDFPFSQRGFLAQPSTEPAPRWNSSFLRDMQNTSLQMDLLPRDNSHQRRWSSSVQNSKRERSPDDRRTSPPRRRAAPSIPLDMDSSDEENVKSKRAPVKDETTSKPSEKKKARSPAQCVICLEKGRKDLYCTTCGHTYHKGCMNEWVKKKKKAGQPTDVCSFCKSTFTDFFKANLN